MSARPDPGALDARLLNLLLASAAPMRASRSDLFRSAWIEAAKGQSAALLGAAEDMIPSSIGAAARALLALSLDIGRAAGISRSEFTDAFNDHGECAGVETLDDAIARAFAFTLALAALREEQRDGERTATDQKAVVPA